MPLALVAVMVAVVATSAQAAGLCVPACGLGRLAKLRCNPPAHSPPHQPLPSPPLPAPRRPRQCGTRLAPTPVLRPALLFRRPFYLYLMVSNLMLRLRCVRVPTGGGRGEVEGRPGGSPE